MGRERHRSPKARLENSLKEELSAIPWLPEHLRWEFQPSMVFQLAVESMIPPLLFAER